MIRTTPLVLVSFLAFSTAAFAAPRGQRAAKVPGAARVQAKTQKTAATPATGLVRIAQTAEANTISIRPRATDPNMSVEVLGNNSIRIQGVANGPTDGRDVFGLTMKGVYAKSVQVGLDVEKAPTTDFLGRTNYTEKNSRHFVVYTSEGATAAQIADALAVKINGHRSFRASVAHNNDGSATMTFSKR